MSIISSANVNRNGSPLTRRSCDGNLVATTPLIQLVPGQLRDELVVSENEISEIFLSWLSDDEFFLRLKTRLNGQLFAASEVHFAVVCDAAIELFQQSGSRPTAEELRLAVERRLTADPAMDAVTRAKLLGPQGLLDRLDHQAVMPSDASNRKELAFRFLSEREIVLPVQRLIMPKTIPNNGILQQYLKADSLAIFARAAVELESLETYLQIGEPWGDIIPLEGRSLPPFPVEVLPDWLREWSQAKATETQTPIDLPAMMALTVASAAISNKIEVEAGPGWLQPLNIYSLVALDSANRKSTVVKAAAEPLRQYEREEVEHRATDLSNSVAEHGVLTERITVLKRNAGKAADSADRQRIISEIATFQTRVNTLLPSTAKFQMLVDDVTIEKLGMILHEQHGRIALLSSEGGVFDIMRGRYNKAGAQFEIFLKAFDGEELRDARVTRAGIFVQQPAITMGIAPQLDVVRRLGDTPAFRDTGLLGRFFFSIPRSLLGSREISPPPVPESVAGAYRSAVVRLCRLPASSVPLRLSEEAARVFEDYQRQLEPRLGPGGDLHSIKDWAGKLAGRVARVSGIVHLANHCTSESSSPRPCLGELPVTVVTSEPISLSAMEAAITIGEYLVHHALAAFELIGAPDYAASRSIGDALCVVEWIVRNNKRTFSKREFHQLHKQRFPHARDVDPAFHLLVQNNFIRGIDFPESHGKGRPPSPRYEVNPAVRANA